MKCADNVTVDRHIKRYQESRPAKLLQIYFFAIRKQGAVRSNLKIYFER